jgi:hypothetical protein
VGAGDAAARHRRPAGGRDADPVEGPAHRDRLRALDEGEAARAEALVLGELAGKTYPQAERLAWRAALAVAPDVAERRRSRAERQARVTVFREQAGTAGLSGRDLPAAQALSGHANVLARARVYEVSGAFPGQPAGGAGVSRPAQRHPGRRPDRVRRRRLSRTAR